MPFSDKRRHTLSTSASVPSFNVFRKESSANPVTNSKPSRRSISFNDGGANSDPEDDRDKKPTEPLPPRKGIFARRHTMVDKGITNNVPPHSPQPLYLEEDPLQRHERQLESLSMPRRNTMVGILGFGKVPKKVTELVRKKRNGGELTWEDTEYFIRGLESGMHVSKEQAGAMMLSMDLKGLSMLECESLMKAMMFSGQLLHWPGPWLDVLASLQSSGSTGNKAKPIVAAAMAAIGLKFPIMSARGTNVYACSYNRMATIPGFDGKKSFSEIRELLEQVGCCIVQQPQRIAPAETRVRDLASKVGISDNNSIKAACMMARVCALKLRVVLLEITCGQSEELKTSAQAEDLVQKLQEMARVMGVRCKVVLTHVSGPVGRMIGQSLGIAEAIRCLNSEGPADLHELVCKIGGHILQAMNRVDTVATGEKLTDKVLKDGSAKKKFVAMLLAQGVDKATVKNLFKHRKDPDEMPSVLPTAKYITHLSTNDTGFVHSIDTTICNKVMFDLAKAAMYDDDDDDDDADDQPDPNNNNINAGAESVGGIQLIVQVGSYLTRGECWAKIHHNVRLTEDMMDDLKHALKVSLDTPLHDMTINMQVMEAPDQDNKERSGPRVKFTL